MLGIQKEQHFSYKKKNLRRPYLLPQYFDMASEVVTPSFENISLTQTH